jgi:hypothetical protein
MFTFLSKIWKKKANNNKFILRFVQLSMDDVVGFYLDFKIFKSKINNFVITPWVSFFTNEETYFFDEKKITKNNLKLSLMLLH